MAGASEATQRVTHVNANWSAGDYGGFEVMIVTEDDERHAVPVSSSDMAALLALTQASPVLLWDPEARTLIAANLVGEWFARDWTAGRPRQPEESGQ